MASVAGVAAGLETPTEDERTMAMLAHLLMAFTGFIGPLVIFLREAEFAVREVSFAAGADLARDLSGGGFCFYGGVFRSDDDKLDP